MLQSIILLFIVFLQRLVILLSAPVWFLSKKARLRLSFEWENYGDEFAKPFHHPVSTAFHISSEGEWEQVWPLIVFELENGEAVEVIVTSPSLKKRLQWVRSEYSSQNIRLLRLPLLSVPWQSVTRWSRARNLYLCRYDFFPDLLWLGQKLRREGGNFGLLAASLKNKAQTLNRKFSLTGIYWRFIHHLFNQRILVSRAEKPRFALFEQYPMQEAVFDFRSCQIYARLNEAGEHLDRYLLGPLLQWLSQVDYRQRLIAGSLWASDLDLFCTEAHRDFFRKGQWRLIIAPHELDGPNLKLISKRLEEVGYSVEITHGQSPIDPATEVVILSTRGVLVELYTQCFIAYIGGGFGRSIHSVKEPYLAGCQVISGPKIERSTEAEEIALANPQGHWICHHASDFLEALQKLDAYEGPFVKRERSYYTQMLNETTRQARALHQQFFF